MSGLNKVHVLWTKKTPSILENKSRQKSLPSSMFQISICCQGQMETPGRCRCLCPHFGWFASPEHCFALLQLCSASASLGPMLKETLSSAELAWPKNKTWLVLHVALLLEGIWEHGCAFCKSQMCNHRLSRILQCICGAQALANSCYTGEYNWILHTYMN